MVARGKRVKRAQPLVNVSREFLRILARRRRAGMVARGKRVKRAQPLVNVSREFLRILARRRRAGKSRLSVNRGYRSLRSLNPRLTYLHRSAVPLPENLVALHRGRGNLRLTFTRGCARFTR